MPCAIITGTAGQDGSYLAELLLEKGYKVYGMIRRNSSFVLDRLTEARKNANLTLAYGDVTDISSIFNIFLMAMKDPVYNDNAPLEVYNLAAQSHVKVSFETPIYTCNADALGVMNILEVIKQLGLEKRARFYQASTSEMYGDAKPPQNENTPFQPRSPYAIAKLYAYWIVRNYREAYGIYAVNGILFNHESERRGETFVSRKITKHVAKHSTGEREVLKIGNLYAKRDWGHAKDYVVAMWKMLQQEKPKDYVIATGKSYTVKEFIEIAYTMIGVQIRWQGRDNEEKGYDVRTNELLVEVDSRYFRPTEVEYLCGDASISRQELDWKPRYSFVQLIQAMVFSDIEKLY